MACQRVRWQPAFVAETRLVLTPPMLVQVNVRPSVFAYAAPLTAEAATEVSTESFEK